MSGYIGTAPVPQATQTRDSFTATSGQTSFATSGYTPNFLDVFLNGVKLAAADYTATNGSDVVLASGAVVNDILEVVAYTAFDTANVTGATNFTVTGAFTSQGIDDNGNATALTIDSSENLLVGQSSSTAVGAGNTTTGFSIRNDGGLYASRSSGPTITANVNADGDIIKLYKSGTTVGSIGVNSGDQVYFAASDGMGIKVDTDNTSVEASNASGADNDNAVNLGSSGTRWKDLYLSGGVYLGGTGAANKLDDYEEGTWTPSFVQAPAGTVSSLAGQYVKVGKLVTVYCQVAGSSLNATDYVRLQGLPFSASDKNATGTYIIGGITNRIHGWTTLTSGTDNWYWSISGSTSATSIVASVTYKI
jgi:rhodanese-related sulfurtransferase